MPDALTPEQQKLKDAYEEFMRRLDALGAKRLEALKKVVGRIEQEKIKEVLEALK